MAQRNADIVRAMYEAWNSGDIEAVLDHIHPEFELNYRAGVFPGIDPDFHGRDGFKAFTQEMRGPWDSLEIVLDEMRESGNTVATAFTFEGRGRSGIAVSRRVGNVITFREGAVIGMDAFGDWTEALDAAGIG